MAEQSISVLPNTANGEKLRDHARSRARAVSTELAGADGLGLAPAAPLFLPSNTDHGSGPAPTRTHTPRVTILSFSEARAHNELLTLIDQRSAVRRVTGLLRHEREAAKDWLSRQMDRSLLQFAPRCNCGRVLETTTTSLGVRWSCACGFKGVTVQ